MLPFKRSQRLGHELKKDISDIISNRLNDPRVGFLTVTDVELTDDLKLARVFISVLKDEESEPTMEALKAAASFIRTELGRRLHVRSVPTIEFKLDTSARYGQKIDELFRKIHSEEQSG